MNNRSWVNALLLLLVPCSLEVSAAINWSSSCSVQIFRPVPVEVPSFVACTTQNDRPDYRGDSTSDDVLLSVATGSFLDEQSTRLTAAYSARRNYGDIAVMSDARVVMIGNGVGGTASAAARVSFVDTITPASSILAPHEVTLVTLNYGLLFAATDHYYISNLSNSPGDRMITTQFSATALTNLGGEISVVSGTNSGGYGGSLPPGTIYLEGSPFGYSFQRVVEVRIGEPFQLQGMVSASAYVNGYERLAAPGAVNVLNSTAGGEFFFGSGLRVFMEPFDTDVNLIAVSGHNYSIGAAVPELNSVSYLILGGIFTAILIRRRRVAPLSDVPVRRQFDRIYCNGNDA